MELPRALAFLCLLLPFVASVTDRGVLYLDDFTFDKIIDGSRDVLVRFDKEYSWGDDHDAFKELANKVGESGQGLLVASVPVAKRDYDFKNADLAAKYQAADESSFPVYLVFKKGVSARGEPVRLPAGAPRKADDLLAWAARSTGAFFGLKGQIKELDVLARELMASADADARKAVAARAEGLVAGVGEGDQEAAAYYVKVLAKAADRPEFPATEAKRLGNLLAGKVTDAKRAAMQLKLNVLASFAAGGPKAAAAKADL